MDVLLLWLLLTMPCVGLQCVIFGVSSPYSLAFCIRDGLSLSLVSIFCAYVPYRNDLFDVVSIHFMLE